MTRVFAEPSRWRGTDISLDRDESRHISQVLRLHAGGQVTVFDGEGRVAHAEIVSLDRDGAQLAVLKEEAVPGPPVELHLFLALLKGPKMELVLQKAVELGASSVHPLITEHAVAKIKPNQLEEKMERWRKILISAAKQCGANRLPTLEKPCSVSDSLPAVQQLDRCLTGALHPDALPLAEELQSWPSGALKAVGVCVGPEGDFSSQEYEMLRQGGSRPVNLGPRVLRAETAAIYFLSVLSYELEQDKLA